MMSYEKKRQIENKCEHKFVRYDTAVDCAYIQSHDSDLLYYVQQLTKRICTCAGSARDCDAIMSGLASEVAELLRIYAKED